MPDVDERRSISEEPSSGADGLHGSPKETGTERSEVEASGFKSHPRRLTEGSEPL
jgi:hypothetical protein